MQVRKRSIPQAELNYSSVFVVLSERTDYSKSEGFDLLPTKANDTIVKSLDNNWIKQKIKILFRISLDKCHGGNSKQLQANNKLKSTVIQN